MSKKRKIGLITIIILIILALMRDGRHLLTINMSDSLPRGIYLLQPKNRLQKGDIVLIELKNNERTKRIKLLKKITAVAGDVVEIRDNELYINNISTKRKLEKYDSEGNLLVSQLKNKTILKNNEYFLEGTHTKSYDSKYFGVVKDEFILYKAKKIF